MPDLRNAAIGILFALVLLLAGTSLWQRAEAAKARLALAEFQRAAEQAAEAQREANRGKGEIAAKQEAARGQARERFITKVEKEIVYVAAPLADCALPADAVRLLNDARRCAIEGTAAACGSGDGLPGTK